MIRNREIIIKVSKEELEKIKGKAVLLGLKPSAFGRMVLLSSRVEVETE